MRKSWECEIPSFVLRNQDVAKTEAWYYRDKLAQPGSSAQGHTELSPGGRFSKQCG